jgi:hypothetical protein
MGFFGAFFAAMTLYWQFDVTGWALAIPFIGFAAIALAAAHVIRQPGEGIAPSPKAARVIMWSSIGEGIGLFLASNIVINLQRPEWLMPAMALVVGAHFIPIARAVPFRPFLALGAALMLAGAVGFVVPSQAGGAASGFLAALGLWTAAILAVRRDRRFKQASG